MKTILLAMILALTSLPLLAQTPPGLPGTPGTGLRRPLYNPRPMPAPGVAAPSAAAPAEEMIPPGTIDFTSADVSQVLDIYAKLVNRTILRAALPDAKIILKTQTPLTRTEAIEALQAVLAMNNISLIPMGDKFLKVVQSDQANSAGGQLDVSGSTNLPDLGTYVTHIAQLKYVKPSIMVQIIQPFAKLQGGLQPIDDNGILVMRDYAENIKRMLEMIDRIDVSVPAEYISEVIPIRYAKVDEIASALNSLGGSGGGSTVSIGTPAGGGGAISGFGNRGASSSGVGGGGGGGSGYQSGTSGGSTFGTRSTSTGVANPNGTPTTGTTFQQRLQNIIGQSGGGGGGQKDQIQLFGQTKIIPNESSSTLLIYATRQDMAMIKEIIAKLDVPLAQVLVEAIIMDVTLGKTFSLGVSAAQNPKAYTSTGGSTNPLAAIIGGGGINNGQSFFNFLSSTLTNGTTSTSGNSIGNSLTSGGLSYFGNIGPTYDLAVQAAESDTSANVIQRPRIQTSQAKAAQFFVGETVPYVTGNTYGGAYGNSSSYSQLSVGVELDVTPFINPDGEVTMDIAQEIDDLDGFTDISGVGQVPNTIKRTLNTTITVRDRDTVMLGGFIKTDKSTSRSGVPFLSDIPLLGNLFSQRNDSKDREELIVLMRPTVLKTPALAARNTVLESQRLPGTSAAAADEAEDEHKLEAAQRQRELRAAKNGSNTNGFYNVLMPEDDTNNVPNTVPPSAIENTAPQTPPDATLNGAGAATAPDAAAIAQEKARADFQNKVNAMDAPRPAEVTTPAMKKQLDAALNDWMAGKTTTEQYTAIRDKILAQGQ
jgi:general secretion pathway protein D